jgi:vacuolar-type H+-ATPase subunit C/Vma6
MQTSYIYSTSRVNTVSEELLTKADIDRLLVATPGADFTEALKETYLAHHLIQNGNDIRIALDESLHDAKKLLVQIVPKKDLLRAIWLQYDIHNLRVLAKAAATEIGRAHV